MPGPRPPVNPSLEILIPERAGDLRRWFAGEVAGELVKRYSGRAVWRVAAGSPALYVKQSRRLLFRDRARKEARILRTLAEAGIPCPRLVAVGRDGRDAYLVTEEVRGAVPLGSRLCGGGPEVRALLAAFADLLRRLHDAGLEHLDLHAGNVLARGGELFVIDVHDFRRAGTVSAARRRRGVAFALLSFYESVPATETLRFLRRYGYRSREDLLSAWNLLRRLQSDYYARREGRCLEDSSGFGRRGGTFFRKGTGIEEHLAGLERGTAPAGVRIEPVKRGIGRQLWRNAHALSLRGVEIPRFEACGPGWIAYREVEGPTLEEFARRAYPALDRGGRNEILFRLARLLRRMHDRGAHLPGLEARGIRVAERGMLVSRPHPARFSASVPERDRISAVARLHASVPGTVSRTDRLRFLRRYFGRDGALWDRRRAWIGRISALAGAGGGI